MRRLLSAFLLAAAPLRAAATEAELRREEVRWAVAGGGLFAASILLDSEIHRGVNRTVDGRLGKQLDGRDFGRPGGWLELLGRPETTLGVNAALYTGGVLSGSPRMKRFSIVSSEAVLAAGTAALAVKFAVGRKRPDRASDADQFHPFGGTTRKWVSFPSGHTTTAFAWASVTAEEFPSPWVAAGAYGLAGAVGFSRVYQADHWASDIVAGAALGFFTGKMVHRWNARGAPSFAVTTDGRSLFLSKRF